ncbi:hypothetical protein DFP72DRAFT_372707 [Ephemerocybe angulata]|uniref:Uncharacterized protein n=1 Tax=Ephemerocybe angulata TaxID=980116 RepID=A0A8H6HZ66_9AGAR|nr:hypothetical protein DFP72DRAFT_372707 [Tulosesus angulatus]
MQSLEELTFNSRPVIQHLSSLAQEYSRYADIVVSCVETHIRRICPRPLPFKLQATLTEINIIENDVDMQPPPSEWGRYIIMDTNILFNWATMRRFERSWRT